MGFQGFIVSDWGAQHSGLASAAAGLDMAMPDSTYWENGNLTLMVSNGSLAQSRLDDMATRILAPWYKYAENPNPGAGMPLSQLTPHKMLDARDPASKPTILQGAVEGHVLVKNTNNALPLKNLNFISLFGYDAVAYTQNTPINSSFSKWPFGLENTQIIDSTGQYFNDTILKNVFLSSEPANYPVPAIAINGTMISGGGSGATQPSYVDAPFDAFQRQTRQDNTFLQWDFYNLDPVVPGGSEAAIVFINAQSSEGWDRPNLADNYSDTLVENVAAKCNNTMVVIHNAGVRLVDAWIDNPNITAVIYAHLPGQDSGQALVDIMYGTQSPSGRLPYTVAKKASDYGNLLSPALPSAAELYHTQANFTEGVYIDYKYFIAQNITPRYAFGYGLTYSTFNYSGLQAAFTGSNDTAPVTYSNSTATPSGGDPALFQTVAEVTATITNTGSVAAAEVAQLYVNIPGGPAKQLRGFAKEFLHPGESVTVTFELMQRDLSSWDVTSQAWVLQKGSYAVYVGKSVLDIQLQGSITV